MKLISFPSKRLEVVGVMNTAVQHRCIVDEEGRRSERRSQMLGCLGDDEQSIANTQQFLDNKKRGVIGQLRKVIHGDAEYSVY